MNSKFILLILIVLFLDGYRLSIADVYANVAYADLSPEEQSFHNECAGISRKIISGPYLYEGGHFCETSESIETRSNVEIGDSADVTFKSKTVSLGALFTVNNSSFFRIQTTGIGLNNELSGTIFIGSGFDGPWTMDLKTGHYKPIPGVDWDAPTQHPSIARFSAHPSRDGIEFVETVENCRDTGTLDFEDCFVFHDRQGAVIHQFNIPHGAYGADGPAKMSFDRQFLAVPVAAEGIFGHLRLFTRSGVLLSESNETVRRPDDFDWLPDNRLIYASGQTIFLSDIGTAQGTPLIVFPQEQGKPSQLAVSPDGAVLAFTLVTSASYGAIHGTTWLLDLSSGQVHQLTDTAGPNDPNTTADDPQINFPTWSPDGQWVLVVESSSRSAVAYAVPSNGEKVILSDTESTSARPILSYYLETLGVFNEPPSNLFDVDAGGLLWLH